MIVGFVDKSFQMKIISDSFAEDLVQGSFRSAACGRNAAWQIKWLSCMFTSIFGDISMTIQAETLFKGEGWQCSFTQERAALIHQQCCCPFSTVGPGCTLLTTCLLSPAVICRLPVCLCRTLKSSPDFIPYQTCSSAHDLTASKTFNIQWDASETVWVSVNIQRTEGRCRSCSNR